VKTEIVEASGIPKEELEKVKDSPVLAAKDIAESVLYVLGTPPHVQVSIEGNATAVTDFAGP
jgi:NADP-dependent 3-hydroxy acid dehydrogenase YdfG